MGISVFVCVCMFVSNWCLYEERFTSAIKLGEKENEKGEGRITDFVQDSRSVSL